MDCEFRLGNLTTADQAELIESCLAEHEAVETVEVDAAAAVVRVRARRDVSLALARELRALGYHVRAVEQVNRRAL